MSEQPILRLSNVESAYGPITAIRGVSMSRRIPVADGRIRSAEALTAGCSTVIFLLLACLDLGCRSGASYGGLPVGAPKRGSLPCMDDDPAGFLTLRRARL